MGTVAKRRDFFARLSLDYADHPKIAGLSDAAFRAHIEMILYSRRYLTDGQIAKQIAKRWLSSTLDELASNDPANPSLSKQEDGSYLIHGFSEMQETRSEVLHKKEIRAAAGRRGGLAKAGKVPSKLLSKNVAEVEVEVESNTLSEVADATARPDVVEILDYLDQRISENDPERNLPKRIKRNVDAARLLLDKDGKTIEQVKAAIDFSQTDEFWRVNILSMSKLREKYDQLRLKAQRANHLRAVDEPRPEPPRSLALTPKCPTCNAPQQITHYEDCSDKEWRPTA